MKQWLLVMIALGRTGPAAAQSPLRLEEAIHLALTRNERSQVADLQVAVAHAALERARAGFLPILAANANEAERSSSTTSHAGTATITFTQPLVNLPTWPLYGQARQLLDAQSASSSDDKRTLSFDAARAFLSALIAAETLKAADRRLDAASANLANTQARAQAQLASTNDVSRAQIDFASAERERELDRGALEAALIQLGFVIVAPVGTPPAPPDAVLASSLRPLAAPDSLVRFALQKRPDVLASRHAALAARDAAAEPLLRLAPSIAATAQAQGTTGQPADKTYEESVAITLSWTLFDAGVRYADKHARDAQAAIAELNLRALERNVDAQVRAASALLASAQVALKASREAMLAAQRSLEETTILYKQGLAKAIELVDGTDSRFIAEVNFASAQYSLAQAWLNLRQAVGLDPLVGDLP
jgi:outer membrane protein TolC